MGSVSWNNLSCASAAISPSRRFTSGFKEEAGLEQLGPLSKAYGALDELPFGAIQLDPEGRILAYNMAESKLTGRAPSSVLGKNFFTEVAPCTNVQAFAGRFREGVKAQKLHAVFPYRFDFKMQPIEVQVALYYDATERRAWVFVRRRDGTKADQVGSP